eukprot:TRINITY_DN4738_c0_g1_i4.p1 TRINITY_DN4738_c0_g1~~TRINITY_DN4738_c0_g1_i4.p1  ORF type:complete len:460 (-),score=50.06 TRINITY_DN4738_c0_g1_i4:2710-4089(-)
MIQEEAAILCGEGGGVCGSGFSENEELACTQSVRSLPYVSRDSLPPLPIKQANLSPFDPVAHPGFGIYGGVASGFAGPSAPLLSPQSPLPPVNSNGYLQYGVNDGGQLQMFFPHNMYYMPMYPTPQPPAYPPGHFYPPPTYLQPSGSNYSSLAWQSSQLGYKMMMNKSKWEIHKRRNQQQQCMAEKISRTVYITDLDCTLTEETLAEFFSRCGEIVDVRVCGDPNCPQKFAFIEFTESYSAMKALQWSGQTLGKYVLKVLPSKTAIIPVNKEYMPKNSRDMERCSRTIYVTNINKSIGREDLRSFFETLCGGEIAVLRLLGDKEHPTRIAFVEFRNKECAAVALNVLSGYTIGGVAIRVAPSKTPVRLNDSSQMRPISSPLPPSPPSPHDVGFDPKPLGAPHKLNPTSPDFQPNTPHLLSYEPHFNHTIIDYQESYIKCSEQDNDSSSDTHTQESSTQK